MPHARGTPPRCHGFNGKRDNGNLESNDRELKEIEKRLETMISLLVSIRSEGTAP